MPKTLTILSKKFDAPSHVATMLVVWAVTFSYRYNTSTNEAVFTITERGNIPEHHSLEQWLCEECGLLPFTVR